MADADLILLVVDVRTGITEEDAQLARRLRRATVPVLLVANKADSPNDASDVTRFERLGLGEPLAVSALHGHGTGELLDRIVDVFPPDEGTGPALDEPRFAIVGRPNVGKSRLFNRLLGEERSVVSELPGTTRDSVDSVIDWPGLGRVRFVDTAGMRRGQSVRGVEYYSFLRAAEAIDRAHVAVVVLDAADGFTTEDKKIVNRVMDAGRALVVVANKWDLVEEKDRTYKDLAADPAAVRARERRPHVCADRSRRAPSSAGADRPAPQVDAARADVEGERHRPGRTGGEADAQEHRDPPLRHAGLVRPSAGSCSSAERERPTPAYRRYLEHRLREELGLDGVPIVLTFRPRRSRPARSD